MDIEILAIGDEILLGQIENTNSGWIARELSSRGLIVKWMSVIADNEKEIFSAFQRSFRRADVTIITGGLGPTHDDLTKSQLAKFFDLPIVFRNDLLEDVREMYRKRQLSFIETSREQAEFPEGAVPIRSIHGTAPGIWIEKSAKTFVAMPGVPLEMRAMMKDFVIPRLLKNQRGPVKKYKNFHSIGTREAQLYKELKNLAELEKYASLAFLPSYSGVKMRLTVEGDTPEIAELNLNKAEAELRKNLGKYIFGAGENFTIEAGVGELLKREHLKITIAESCTGGLFCKRMTDTPGSTAWFERGFITYSNEAKHELLGVPYKMIEDYGAVSSHVAEAMAEGALRRSRAQVAISITGIAGPSGGSPDKPVGLVYVGYADNKLTTHRKYNFGTDRNSNRLYTIASAIVFLVEQLSQKTGLADPELL